ncbi:MAG: NADH-quinone oxidoreductase subunit E [Rikenellaceae bacterium]|nr:NADH-quinone oxidoreductase subunit E [Rikenellaceae bacterium]
MHVGFVFLIVGFVIGSGNGSIGGFQYLADYFAGNPPLWLFVLFLIGFGMKAGLFPLHIWMPEAYSAAPSYVSGCLSGAMSKLGIYGILRVLTSVGPDLRTVGVILLAAGIVTALWGIAQAVLQNDLKKLLACFSIENIGIIVTAIGAGTLGLSAGNQLLALFGYGGALLHVVNHSLYKPLLFMGAGSVALAAGTRNLEQLGGLSCSMPVTTMLFLCGAIGICALPPFNGFISEFLIYSGFLQSAAAGSLIIWSVVGMAALALVGGIAVLVFCKAFGIGFLGIPRSPGAAAAKEVSSWMLAAQMLPLAGMLSIGLFPGAVVPVMLHIAGETFLSGESWRWIAAGAQPGSLWGISMSMALLITIVAGLAFWRSRVHKKQSVSRSPTWGCGFTEVHADMQYTGESFSEGFEHMRNSPSPARSYTKRRGQGVPHEELFARPHRFGVRHKDRVDSLISERWAYLVRKLNARLALFQTGKINHYILHALLFLALVFLITWIGWI